MAQSNGSSTTTTPALDFEAMLAREYRPSNIIRLVPREKYEPRIADDSEQKKKRRLIDTATLTERKQEEAAARLVESLIEQTPGHKQHAMLVGSSKPDNNTYEQFAAPMPHKKRNLPPIPHAFLEIELGDWESQIYWNGVPKEFAKPVDPMAILRQPRNHHLDCLDFSDAVRPHTKEELLEKARNVPLVLELGVAGQSVANVVYQNTALYATRPPSALKSEAYKQRVERSLQTNSAKDGKSSNAKSLQSAKDEKMAEYEARQNKRAQMAEDKTARVKEAMGTMTLGGGRGRTVTSSLMGPGGTERTGRPSRTVASGFHEIEYVEQLDLVNNHSMVRSDWSKVFLRQHLRPKLPMNVVRPGLPWQFQVRFIPAAKKAEGGQSGAFQSMIGTHAGAISKERLRTEADLSPTEGNLILLEYSEERPPIQLTKGMCSKIVNYYRGDRAKCPVSAGGGDRPSRRKRGGESTDKHSSTNQSEASSHLPEDNPNVIDWIGKLPKKSQKDRAEQEAIDILPEGVTEILHNRVHGPFIGPIKDGQTITGFVNNAFVVPLFRQEPQTTDFLMILTPTGGAARAGRRETMGVVLRDLPTSTFTVGQTEPRTKVQAPNSQGEKNFLTPFVMFQIARLLTRSMSRDGHGLTLEEIKERAVPCLEIPINSLRQRLKGVATFEKKSTSGGIWSIKPTGFEEFQGFDALSKSVQPEGVAAFGSAFAARRRLSDLGVEQLVERGGYAVLSTGVIMVYLAGQLNATREIYKKVKKLCEHNRGLGLSPVRVQIYEKARQELETLYKTLEKRHDVAQFIYEELQLAPWNLTKEFIDVHIGGEGTGMLRLTGLGDPTGKLGEGFSFIRALDAKPTKSVGANIVTDKISGTQNDLRKLSMKEMGNMLREYGMAQKKIDTLKRWDRVHCIRDFSTRAASDGLGDGLERFARGEKMKLSDQKLEYTKRIQMIWERQHAALSAPGIAGVEADTGPDGDTAGGNAAKKANAKEDSDSDSESGDSDFFDELETELAGRTEANQLLAGQTKSGDGRSLDKLRAAARDHDLSKEAKELAEFQREEKKAKEARENLKSIKTGETIRSDRKIVRRRITKTHPDGRQTITFNLHPDEVGRIMDKLQNEGDKNRRKGVPEYKYERGEDERPPGHAMFEDEDDFDYSQKGRIASGRRRGGQKKRGVAARNAARNKELQFGKFKAPKATAEERAKKRKKEEEELEVYSSSVKRKGTNNRKERGSIRDRRPHVIFAEKLEAIRQTVEVKNEAAPFRKPVPRKKYPRYYEMISHPIDLSTIRTKISGLKYNTANELLLDFELMKKNAIRFNGETAYISNSALSIHDFVKSQIDANRKEFSDLESAISEYWSTGGNPSKKQKTAKTKAAKMEGKNEVANVGGVTVNLGDITAFDSDTDSE